MAHFRSTIKGHRGEASRLGTKTSGMDATVASWQGAVSVRLWHDEETGQDMAEVALATHHGAGVNRVLYRGPVCGATCECSDPGCPVCHGECSNPGTAKVFRSDMEDETGMVTCEGCAEDCLASGVFRS